MWFNSQNHNENQKERKDSMTKWKEMLHKEQKYLQELLNQLEKQEKRNLAVGFEFLRTGDIRDIITARVTISGACIFLKRI